MKVLILDTLINQASKDTADHSKLTKKVIDRIHKEYGNLARLEKAGTLSLRAYINRQDAKPMRGVKDVYKYRLTDGDRIIYTKGETLEYISPEDRDSIVLLAYAKHDDQERVAKRVSPWADRNKKHVYLPVSQFRDLAKECDINLEIDEFDEETQEFIYSFIKDEAVIHEHKLFVVPEDEYLDLDPDLQDVSLVEAQNIIVSEFHNKNTPTLVLGGAGTGKTIICMHVLNNYVNSVNKKTCFYFTQSKELLGKVERKLKYINRNYNENNNVYLRDINDFCLSLVGEKRVNLIETRQFTAFIDSRSDLKEKCIRNSIDPITVWTEIRGTIKGYMGRQWIRTMPVNQNVFSGSINSLVNKKYFRRRTEDARLIELEESVSNTLRRAKNDNELKDVDIINIKKACDHFGAFDSSIKSLTKEQYYSLNDEDTTIEKSSREAIWQIYNAYEEWKGVNFFDENDLVLKVIKLGEKILPESNLIVVDEVQDYTELQLYLLFRMNKVSKGKIIFAGDVNQNVNPTFFSEDHLKLLFDTNSSQCLAIKHLTSNFRCSQPIVDVANNLSELRKKSIASHSQENELPEQARFGGEEPYRLEYSRSNIIGLLRTMAQYPRVALLVPNSSTKDYLINMMGVDEYENSVAPFIFSVEEIKGMEYAYVVCFNLSSQYNEIWNRILNKKDARKKTKYRYYFNLLYVAITRAEKYLCFIDEKTILGLDNKLKLKNINVFDSNELFFSSLSKSTDEMIRQAKEFFDSGLYKEALQMYSRLGMVEETYKCKQRIAEENHEYEEALKYYMLHEFWDPYTYIDEVPIDSQLRIMHDDIFSNIKNTARESYAVIINHFYQNDEECIRMQELILEKLYGNLYEGIEQLKESLEEKNNG